MCARACGHRWAYAHACVSVLTLSARGHALTRTCGGRVRAQVCMRAGGVRVCVRRRGQRGRGGACVNGPAHVDVRAHMERACACRRLSAHACAVRCKPFVHKRCVVVCGQPTSSRGRMTDCWFGPGVIVCVPHKMHCSTLHGCPSNCVTCRRLCDVTDGTAA